MKMWRVMTQRKNRMAWIVLIVALVYALASIALWKYIEHTLPVSTPDIQHYEWSMDDCRKLVKHHGPGVVTWLNERDEVCRRKIK